MHSFGRYGVTALLALVVFLIPTIERERAAIRAEGFPVEEDARIEEDVRIPEPPNVLSFEEQAVVFATEGRIEEARWIISGLPSPIRGRIAGDIFQAIHPRADAGDDVGTGPAMELVLEFQPDNFQALYHAGMAAQETGHTDRARAHLEKFLELYQADDGWTQRARAVLEQTRPTP